MNKSASTWIISAPVQRNRLNNKMQNSLNVSREQSMLEVITESNDHKNATSKQL